MKKPHFSLAKEVCDCLLLISTDIRCHGEVTISVPSWPTWVLLPEDICPQVSIFICLWNEMVNVKAKHKITADQGPVPGLEDLREV